MELAQVIVVTAFLSAVLTVIVSPIWIALYRQRVRSWMGKNADGSNIAPEAYSRSDSVGFDNQIPQTVVTWHVVTLDSSSRGNEPKNDLVRLAEEKLRLLRSVYLRAGIVFATILTILWIVNYREIFNGDLPMAIYLLAIVFAVFMLPTVAVHLWLGTGTRIQQVVRFGSVLVLLMLISLPAIELLINLFMYYLFAPLIVFLILNLRYWRGVAPFVALIMTSGSLLAVMVAILAAPIIGVNQALSVIRLAGFALGAWIGVHVLRRIGASYQANGVNDIDLFVNTWWFLYSFWLAFAFGLKSLLNGNEVASTIFMVAVFTAFLIYIGVKSNQLRHLQVIAAAQPCLRLLNLRVFRDDMKSERLFNQMNLQWRCVGPIELIAGWDLALRNIEPLEFVEFLAGNLRRRFVRDQEDLARRMADLDDHPSPGGLHPVHDFLCFMDTWENAMHALVGRADVVLMDLRGFTKESEGCRRELRYLASTAVKEAVILLVDSTALDTVQQLLSGAQTASKVDAAWVLAKITGNGRAVEANLFSTLMQIAKIDSQPETELATTFASPA